MEKCWNQLLRPWVSIAREEAGIRLVRSAVGTAQGRTGWIAETADCLRSYKEGEGLGTWTIQLSDLAEPVTLRHCC